MDSTRPELDILCYYDSGTLDNYCEQTGTTVIHFDLFRMLEL